jgi:antitoxin HigA-1
MKTNLLAPILPGEILYDDFMKPQGISINKLARDISVPANRISNIVNGKRGITSDTALRLELYFGVEAQFWLNLQSEYDLRLMKRKCRRDLYDHDLHDHKKIQSMVTKKDVLNKFEVVNI